MNMGKLIDALAILSKDSPNELDQMDRTMIEALTHLESLEEDLCALKNKKQGGGDFNKFIEPLLKSEKKSKENPKSWRIVIDMATEDGVYIKHPNIQICSGPPSYHRYIMNFENGGVKVKVETECVVKKPALKSIHSKESPNESSISLADIKKFYDHAHIQRIAVLGSARVFAHPELIDPTQPDLGQKVPEDKHLWAQKYNTRVQIELNKFLDVMEETQHNFMTVNGGWAGHQEQSTGIPLISSLIGAISDAEHDYSLPPITIMPEVGAFDRVTTRADAYKKHRLPLSVDESHEDQDVHTYFEIPGGWGDDSKYLVGLSTGLLVFEPYGFWTNIEIANGVAQDKPVAIIADPDSLKLGGAYYEKMKNGEKYVEIEIPLPDDEKGVYRIYRDTGDATQWINRHGMKKMMEMEALEDLFRGTSGEKGGHSFFSTRSKIDEWLRSENLKMITRAADIMPVEQRKEVIELLKTLPVEQLEILKKESNTAQRVWDEQYGLVPYTGI
jgi:hypothetical protein